MSGAAYRHMSASRANCEGLPYLYLRKVKAQVAARFQKKLVMNNYYIKERLPNATKYGNVN